MTDQTTTRDPAANQQQGTAPSNVPMTQNAPADGPTSVVAMGLDEEAMKMMQDAGPTSDATRDDMITPYLVIVQSMSPYVKRAEPEFIPEAREGDILDTLSLRLRAEARIIPCKFQVHYTEWKANRGALVKQWFTDPAGYNQAQGDFGTRTTAEGNEISPSGVFYSLLVEEDGRSQPVLVAMAGTQYKKARRLNSLIASLELQGPQGPFVAPCFARSYVLRAVPESNDQGSWMGWQIEPSSFTTALPQGKMLFQKAMAFRKSVEDGAVQPQNIAPQAAPEGGAQSNNPNVASARRGVDDDGIPF